MSRQHPTPGNRKCSTCYAFVRLPPDATGRAVLGRCHRFPPSVMDIGGLSHPVVTGGQGCFEHKPLKDLIDDATLTIDLNLEESGWICHALMRDAMTYTRNPLIAPGNTSEQRFRCLYDKVSMLNDWLMGKHRADNPAEEIDDDGFLSGPES